MSTKPETDPLLSAVQKVAVYNWTKAHSDDYVKFELEAIQTTLKILRAREAQLVEFLEKESNGVQGDPASLNQTNYETKAPPE